MFAHYKLKKIYILVLVIIFLNTLGCAVSKIEKRDSQGNLLEVYTVLNDPEKLLATYVKTSTTDGSLDLTGKVLKDIADPKLKIKYATAVQQLAEKYDQLNTQTLSLCKTAIVGLNSNPSNSAVQNKFWETLTLIANKSYDMRLLWKPTITTTHLDSSGNLWIGKEQASNTKLFEDGGGYLSFWTPNNITAKYQYKDMPDWQKINTADLDGLKKKMKLFNDLKDENNDKNLARLQSKAMQLEEDITNIYFFEKLRNDMIYGKPLLVDGKPLLVDGITGLRFNKSISSGRHDLKQGMWWKLTVTKDFDLKDFNEFYSKFWGKPTDEPIYIEFELNE